MNDNKKATSSEASALELDFVPAEKRTSWTAAAAVFAGCDLNIPIIFVGAYLAQGLKFGWAFLIMILGVTAAQVPPMSSRALIFSITRLVLVSITPAITGTLPFT